MISRINRAMLFAALAATGGLAACHKGAHDEATDGPIVARVGSRAISAAEFKQKALNQSPVILASLTTLEKKKEFLERLIRLDVLMQESVREGFDKDDEVKEAKAQGMAEDKVHQKMANEMTHDKFDKDPALRSIPEAELRAFYDAHLSDYVKPDRVRLEIILLKGSEGDRKVLGEAQRLLADLTAKATKGNGGAFATTARVRSDDEATKPHGGETGFKTQADLTQAYGAEVAQAAMGLKANGDLSGVVRGKGGWYLLKLMTRQGALNETFDQVSPMIEKRLLAEKRAAMIDAWVAELRSKANVVVYDDELNKIDLKPPPPVN
jgi:peptidyl-prolyl cis-trans isomerase C